MKLFSTAWILLGIFWAIRSALKGEFILRGRRSQIVTCNLRGLRAVIASMTLLVGTLSIGPILMGPSYLTLFNSQKLNVCGFFLFLLMLISQLMHALFVSSKSTVEKIVGASLLVFALLIPLGFYLALFTTCSQ